jgi:DNA processing protein
VVIVSGLAKGIDSAAHRAALSCDGDTVGVIGTGFDRAYPACNSNLQEVLASDYLLLSPFPPGSRVRPGNFPYRNRVMAALSDATVIAEAANGSGALYQATATVRLGRPLFLPRAVVEESSLTWPANYLGLPGVHVFEHPDEILERLLLPRLARAS